MNTQIERTLVYIALLGMLVLTIFLIRVWVSKEIVRRRIAAEQKILNKDHPEREVVRLESEKERLNRIIKNAVICFLLCACVFSFFIGKNYEYKRLSKCLDAASVEYTEEGKAD